MRALATFALIGLAFFGKVESKASQDFLASKSNVMNPVELHGDFAF